MTNTQIDDRRDAASMASLASEAAGLKTTAAAIIKEGFRSLAFEDRYHNINRLEDPKDLWVY